MDETVGEREGGTRGSEGRKDEREEEREGGTRQRERGKVG